MRRHFLMLALILCATPVIAQQTKTRNASDLTGKYFDRFFCLAEVPSNTQRFLPVRQRIQTQIEQLRINGRLAI